MGKRWCTTAVFTCLKIMTDSNELLVKNYYRRFRSGNISFFFPGTGVKKLFFRLRQWQFEPTLISATSRPTVPRSDLCGETRNDILRIEPTAENFNFPAHRLGMPEETNTKKGKHNVKM